MNSSPLVTVVCLCYNHARFVQEAIDSVMSQRYPNIQIIIVDDASTDTSVGVIRKIIDNHPSIEFLPIQNNLGNCKAFNQGLTRAKGEFVIDMAADDILLPTRIETGVRVLQHAGQEFGVHFSDAELISETGGHLSMHSDSFPHNTVPQGDIYKELISRYFICPPTIMCTREVMDYLKGYDESLTYEDFDFLIRSARKYKYVYSPDVLVKRRVTPNAMARGQFKFFSKDSRSTFIVCEKILKLNKTQAERNALAGRILYELRLNLRLLNFGMAFNYLRLWFKNN